MTREQEIEDLRKSIQDDLDGLAPDRLKSKTKPAKAPIKPPKGETKPPVPKPLTTRQVREFFESFRVTRHRLRSEILISDSLLSAENTLITFVGMTRLQDQLAKDKEKSKV